MPDEKGKSGNSKKSTINSQLVKGSESERSAAQKYFAEKGQSVKRPDTPLATSPDEGVRRAAASFVREKSPMQIKNRESKIQNNREQIDMQSTKDKLKSTYNNP